MKYYAVKNGRTTGIFNSWDECKIQVTGLSGAKYKSFDNEEDARNYLLDNFGSSEGVDIEAYVDGSYEDKICRYAYGCVILKEGNIIHTISGNSSDARIVEMRNVAGEIEASIQAIKWAIQNGYKSIRIIHDYQGIASWANGDWKANKIGTKEYVEFIQNARKKISIHFKKVKGHSGEYYNELADKLAKEGLYKGNNTVDISRIFQEFVEKNIENGETVKYNVLEYNFTEKDIKKFVMWYLNGKGYKEISNIKIELRLLEGIIEIVFQADGGNTYRENMKIFNLEG